MKVVYLVTTQENQQCGVVDYTKQLAGAVKNGGSDTHIEVLSSWSLRTLKDLKKKYARDKDTVFHLQYPSLGMGKSPAPALLPLVFGGKRVVVTLHEFEQFNLIRKMYFFITALTDARFIFTNEYERQNFLRFFPWAKKKSALIPIGNNISVVPYDGGSSETRVIYFGQIAPDKGIEEFLEMVAHLRAKGNDIPCLIMGALLDPSSALAVAVQQAAKEHNIECLYNLSSENVSKELQKSSIAFLAFPEGISDKRGSALACLTHGLSVITKHADLTPEWWKETTYHAQTHEEAADIIETIVSGEGKMEAEQSKTVLRKALKNRKWGHIAEKHMPMYKNS